MRPLLADCSKIIGSGQPWRGRWRGAADQGRSLAFSVQLASVRIVSRELKLERCVDAFQGFGEIPLLKIQTLHSAGEAYQRNILRVSSLVLFPPLAVTIAMMSGRAAGEAMANRDHVTDKELIDAEKRSGMAIPSSFA